MSVSYNRAPSFSDRKSTAASPTSSGGGSIDGGRGGAPGTPTGGTHRRAHTLMDQIGELAKEPFRRVSASPVVRAIRESSDRWARDGDKNAPSVSDFVGKIGTDATAGIKDNSHVKALVAFTRAMGKPVDDLSSSVAWLEFLVNKLFLVGGARPAQCLCAASPKPGVENACAMLFARAFLKHRGPEAIWKLVTSVAMPALVSVTNDADTSSEEMIVVDAARSPNNGSVSRNASPSVAAQAAARKIAIVKSEAERQWDLVQEWAIKLAFQCERLSVQGLTKQCNNKINDALASLGWGGLLEKTCMFFVTNTFITPVIIASLFQCLVSAIVSPADRAKKPDAEYPGVKLITNTFVLPALFMAMTYADSPVSKSGMEQLTALILMHGGNASIISQLPSWSKVFAVLCSGGPASDPLNNPASQYYVAHRPPIWTPTDKSEILKLSVNLVVSVFYHRFCYPPNVDAEKDKAEKEKKLASLPKTFLDFVLLSFDDLEDTLGWSNNTVSLFRVVLVAFITVVQSRSASLKSDYDNKAWPSVFDLMHAIESFLFYCPVHPNGGDGMARPKEKRHYEDFGVHLDSDSSAVDLPLVVRVNALLDSIKLKTAAESVFEADDRKRLVEQQKRWETDSKFFADANEYLNLVPKNQQATKGDPRIKKLLSDMSERLQGRKQLRAAKSGEKLGFFASIAASYRNKQKIKALKKKLKAPKVEQGTEAANVGGGVFNASAQVAAASKVFGSEEKAKEYFKSRRKQVAPPPGTARKGPVRGMSLVSALLIPKYDEDENDNGLGRADGLGVVRSGQDPTPGDGADDEDLPPEIAAAMRGGPITRQRGQNIVAERSSVTSARASAGVAAGSGAKAMPLAAPAKAAVKAGAPIAVSGGAAGIAKGALPSVNEASKLPPPPPPPPSGTNPPPPPTDDDEHAPPPPLPDEDGDAPPPPPIDTTDTTGAAPIAAPVDAKVDAKVAPAVEDDDGPAPAPPPPEEDELKCTKCQIRWSMEGQFCDFKDLPYCGKCYLAVAKSCRGCGLSFTDNQQFITVTDKGRGKAMGGSGGKEDEDDAKDAPQKGESIMYHLKCFCCHHCHKEIPTGDVNPAAAAAAGAAAAGAPALPPPPTLGADIPLPPPPTAADELPPLPPGASGGLPPPIIPGAGALPPPIIPGAGAGGAIAKLGLPMLPGMKGLPPPPPGGKAPLPPPPPGGKILPPPPPGGKAPLPPPPPGGKVLPPPPPGGGAAAAAEAAAKAAAEAKEKADKDALGKGAYVEDGEIYCRKDYLELFAQRCSKCKLPIEGPYLNVSELPYHAACFRCVGGCNRAISGGDYYPVSNIQKRELIASNIAAEKEVTHQGGTKPAGSDAKDTKSNLPPPPPPPGGGGPALPPPPPPGGRKSSAVGDEKNAPPAAEMEVDDEFKHPYCNDCYATQFLPKCVTCHIPIETNGIKISGRAYHLTCIACVESGCKDVGDGQGNGVFAAKQPELDADHSIKPEWLWCEKHYLARFAEKCNTCKLPMSGGIVKLGGKGYHEACFVCGVCKISLAGKQVFSNPSDKPGGSETILCQTHYMASAAVQSSMPSCGICSKPLTGQFLSIRDKKIHVECIACQCCGVTLSHTVQPQLDGPPSDGPSAIYQPSEAQQKAPPPELPPASRHDTKVIEPKGPIRPTGFFCKAHFLSTYFRHCPQCSLPLIKGAIGELAGTQYHGACISCTECKKPQVVKKGPETWKLYCRDHMANAK